MSISYMSIGISQFNGKLHYCEDKQLFKTSNKFESQMHLNASLLTQNCRNVSLTLIELPVSDASGVVVVETLEHYRARLNPNLKRSIVNVFILIV